MKAIWRNAAWCMGWHTAASPCPWHGLGAMAMLEYAACRQLIAWAAPGLTAQSSNSSCDGSQQAEACACDEASFRAPADLPVQLPLPHAHVLLNQHNTARDTWPLCSLQLGPRSPPADHRHAMSAARLTVNGTMHHGSRGLSTSAGTHARRIPPSPHDSSLKDQAQPVSSSVTASVPQDHLHPSELSDMIQQLRQLSKAEDLLARHSRSFRPLHVAQLLAALPQLSTDGEVNVPRRMAALVNLLAGPRGLGSHAQHLPPAHLVASLRALAALRVGGAGPPRAGLLSCLQQLAAQKARSSDDRRGSSARAVVAACSGNQLSDLAWALATLEVQLGPHLATVPDAGAQSGAGELQVAGAAGSVPTAALVQQCWQDLTEAVADKVGDATAEHVAQLAWSLATAQRLRGSQQAAAGSRDNKQAAADIVNPESTQGDVAPGQREQGWAGWGGSSPEGHTPATQPHQHSAAALAVFDAAAARMISLCPSANLAAKLAPGRPDPVTLNHLPWAERRKRLNALRAAALASPRAPLLVPPPMQSSGGGGGGMGREGGRQQGLLGAARGAAGRLGIKEASVPTLLGTGQKTGSQVQSGRPLLLPGERAPDVRKDGDAGGGGADRKTADGQPPAVLHGSKQGRFGAGPLDIPRLGLSGVPEKEQARWPSVTAIANTVWAFTSCGLRAPHLFAALARAALMHPAREWDPSTTCTVLWGFAAWGFYDPPLISGLARVVSSNLGDYSPDQLSQVMWSLATLRHYEPWLWRQLPKALQQYSWSGKQLQPKHAATLLSALATLPGSGGPDAGGMAAAGAAAPGMGKKSGRRGKHSPPGSKEDLIRNAAVQALVRQLVDRVDELQPSDGARALWAAAVLTTLPSPPKEVLSQLVPALLQHAASWSDTQLSQQQLAQLHWAGSWLAVVSPQLISLKDKNTGQEGTALDVDRHNRLFSQDTQPDQAESTANNAEPIVLPDGIIDISHIRLVATCTAGNSGSQQQVGALSVLPRHLRAAALAAAQAEVGSSSQQTGGSGAWVEDIKEILELGIGLEVLEGYGALHGGAMRVDLALLSDSQSDASSTLSQPADVEAAGIAIMRLGPRMYSRSVPHTPIGSWWLARELLQAGGWQVVELPWYEWRLQGCSTANSQAVASRGLRGERGRVRKNLDRDASDASDLHGDDGERLAWVWTKLVAAGVAL